MAPDHHSGEHTIDDPWLARPDGPAGSGEAPGTIGSYRILGKLGEGGMGVVYEAEQQEPRRSVALKIIRGGAAVDETRIKMFQREVETLARLKHPNIAAIYEAGRTPDGLHWFAMELVRGKDLEAYIASRPTTITPDELEHRLRLLAGIARAVHYAHQRGVIHRDLKPTNVIVTESGEGTSSAASRSGGVDVKILDFGLARLTDEDREHTETLTVAGAIKGTLPYMSPEQARGDTDSVDVRTDVYALGVMLYEILVRQRPYDLARATIMEAVRVICEEPPRSMSVAWTGSRRLDRDVETIVGKALAKDPDRRYGSAAEFADDLERYLTSQPILARPPSATYQVRKFAQRHRSLVAGVAATSLAVIAGLVVSTSLYVRAEHERKSAQQVAGFLSSMLEGVGAQVAQGRDTTLLKDILAKTTARIGEELGNDPEIEARLRGVMGVAYLEVADLAAAEVQWGRALEIYRARDGESSMDVAQMYSNFGLLAEARSDYPGAEKYLRQAVDIARRLAPGDKRTPEFETRLAGELINQARYEDARALLEEALAKQRKLFPGPHNDTAVTLNTLGIVSVHLGKLDDAERYYREALEQHRAALGDKHPFVATDIMNNAFVHEKRGRLADAEAAFRDALARYRVLYPDGNDATATCLAGLSAVLQKGGKYDEAEQLQREALAMNEKLYGTRSAIYARALDGLGVLLSAKGDAEAADEAGARSLAIRREIYGGKHPDIASSLNNLGMRMLDRARFSDADRLIGEALEMQKEISGVDSQPALVFMNNLARAREGRGDVAGAEALYREVIERRRRVLGKDNVYVAVSQYYLARMLRDEGRIPEAEALQREAVAIMNASLGDKHQQTFIMELELAEILIAGARNDDAQALARGVKERATAAVGPDARPALEADTVLAKALSAAGRYEESRVLLDDVLARGAKTMSETALASAHLAHASALAGLGRVRDARAEIEDVRAAFTSRYGPDHRTSKQATRAAARLPR